MVKRDEIMSQSIKLEVSLPSPQECKSEPKRTRTETEAKIKKVETLLTGPANPLYSLEPPSNVKEIQNLVLLQAQDIKNVLQEISFRDPTARCHSFPYALAKENEKL